MFKYFSGKSKIETEVESTHEEVNGFLSTDEITLIFTFLEHKEILKMSLICSAFYNATNSNFLWKQIYKINHAIDIPEGNGKRIFFEKSRLDRNWFFHDPKVCMDFICFIQ
jgi:hypothetical protein